jgi:hypothetical protein
VSSLLPPLQWNVPIVDEKGRPLAQFAQLLQKLTLATELTSTNGQIGLADGGVSTAKIADNAVTNAKLADMAAHLIKARKTNSTGDPEDCTLAEILDFLFTARGDILFRGASGAQRLAAGTAGQFLQTQGTGADPVWASSGALALIEKYTADGTTGTKTFSSIPATYTDLEIRISGRGTNAGAQGVAVTVNSVGAGSYDLQRQYALATTNSADSTLGGSSWAGCFNLPGTGATAGFPGGGEMEILGYAQTSLHKPMLFRARHIDSNTTGSGYIVHGSGVVRTTAAISSVTLALAAGNYATGTLIAVYGRS